MRVKLPAVFLLWFSLSVFAARGAKAEELTWGGFFSTGVAWSDIGTPYVSNSYLIDNKAQVTGPTLLGLNLSKELNDEWRIAGQILSRASSADSAAKVDWAFVTYEPNASYQILLGKQKAPLWLTSKYLDVGHAYPWVDPPENTYSMLFLKAFTGASLVYKMEFEDSSANATVYAGDVVYEREPNSPNADSKLRITNMYGLELEWHKRNNLFRLAYNRARWNFNAAPPFELGERTIHFASAGFKVEESHYLLMAEFAHVFDDQEAHYVALGQKLQKEAATLPVDQQADALTKASILLENKAKESGSYVTLGRDVLGDFLVHFTYSELWRPLANGTSQDEKGYALGLNYDINVDSVIKIEAKHIEKPAGGNGRFASMPSRNQAKLYRIGYSLIF